jgi:hypothetical protein
MNKRSAILTAGGLAASFVAGVAVVSANLGLGAPATSSTVVGGATSQSVKPIVKHRLIVIHRRSPGGASRGSRAPVVLPASARSMPSITTTSGSHSSGGETELEDREDD